MAIVVEVGLFPFSLFTKAYYNIRLVYKGTNRLRLRSVKLKNKYENNLYLALAFIFTFAIVSVLSYYYSRLDVAITFVLLVGVWFINVYVKTLYGVAGIIALADLSFAAFVVFIGQCIRSIPIRSVGKFDLDAFFLAILVIFMLFALWFSY